MASPLLISLLGITLRNPIILAAGTAGVLDEMHEVLDLANVGAVTTKSITLEPREGNATWRILPARAGMLNAIGLANPGLDGFLEGHAPRARALPCKVFVSVAGFTVDEFVRVAANLDAFAHDSGASTSGPGASGLAGIELNVSCPNVHTGTEFGSTPAAIRELLGAVRPVVKSIPLWIKLAPTTPDIVGVARAALEAGAQALTIGNTVPAMMIDVERRRPALANVTGGLSGPAIHAVALRAVHEVYRKVAQPAGAPIIAAGGVLRWEDAAEFILAGATAVQMGTALFADPHSPIHVARGLERWVKRQKCANISELVGALVLD
ncbi:dihydroorotate dehydrogenase [soil metagenome]